MNYLQLKEILELVSCDLITQATIQKDGSVIAVDPSDTFLVNLKYDIDPESQDIGIGNINAFLEALNKFSSNAIISIADNKLHIQEGNKFADLQLTNVSSAKIPDISNNYTTVCRGVPADVLNKLSRLKLTIIDSNYYFTSKDKKLYFSVGKENEENVIGDLIGETETESNDKLHFTQNIIETFKSIKISSDLFMSQDTVLKVVCENERFKAEYYIAPRVGQ